MEFVTILPFLFGFGIILLSMSLAAFGIWKQYKIEKALIERGEIDHLVELRKRQHQGPLKNPWMPITFGVAAILTGGFESIINGTLQDGEFFFIAGLFLLAFGIARLLGQRKEKIPRTN